MLIVIDKHYTRQAYHVVIPYLTTNKSEADRKRDSVTKFLIMELLLNLSVRLFTFLIVNR